MLAPPDRGAKFRKCDFQVHTLRDAGWSGPFDPIKDRSVFADALAVDCRLKGLQAIAVTDHHDLCLYKEVRLAAQRELRPDGSEFPIEERLVVFPGVELTLATPACQALLIFDPTIDDATLSLIWGALRLAPTGDASEKTTLTLPLHTELDLWAITNALSCIRTNPEETNPAKFQTLAGRFILLPNVKKGGHKSIMRDGFHSHFAAMPCVGGYIEGCFYRDLEEGNRAVIEGTTPAWGKRALGVFQTSDCRKAAAAIVAGKSVVSFENLGTWPTWVKWSQPSAEALRQACLARKSRISHSEPAFPLLQIAGVVVSDSSFLGPVELGLNPQFNAFIGGRGTGKSSLLEYLRWALCDDPLVVDSSAELPNFQQRRKALVDGTLRPTKGKVRVFYKKNEVLYQIERSVTEKGDLIVVFDPAGSGKPMLPAQVRSEFPIVSYAQKQLSCVGTLPEEINRLITAPVQDRINEIREKVAKEIIPKLKQQRTQEIRLAVLDALIVETEGAIKARKDQVQALQSQLNALSPEQQKIVQAHDGLAQQDQWTTRVLGIPESVGKHLETANTQLQAMGTAAVPEGSPEALRLAAVVADINAFVEKAKQQLSVLVSEIKERSWLKTETRATVESIRVSYAQHVAEYDKCIAANAKNETQLKEIQSLNKVIAELEAKFAGAKTEKAALQAVLDATGSSHWDAYLTALDARATILRAQCETVNGQAQYEFKAELGFCSNGQPVIAAVESLVQGKNVKESESKVRSLAALVCRAAHPVKKWAEVMSELDALLATKGAEPLPATPILVAAGFTGLNLTAIRGGLAQDGIEQCRFQYLDDQIFFNFRMGKNSDGSPHYIPFSAASPGQQATCLLRTLLAQTGAPLLIDQPEEDLDNEQIQILSERIGETKHNRQLLFVSHNANIVVNGDAELIACFGYYDSNDNSQGRITDAGSIDSLEIRERITAVMEGGREAFDLRRSKYGF